ncbi:MAG TPA: helix-turn-helix domain-containing protein [Spirochaetota bacterium]|nr:helix-turn-helix domain-containing protein [Spirochaetota bacterium]HPI91187.1 helix-turn-helix domain-containing protein [Spirochaetota bacterium]HPR49475.1 helix-turn-helix domain-containing protein [Spirochaetota bacterium]
METIITVLYLVTTVIAVTFSLLQLVLKDKKAVNYFLAFLYFIIAWIFSYYLAFRSGILASCPFLIYTDIAACFLFGPAMYLYYKSLFRRPVRLSVSTVFHFFPFCVTILFLVVFNPAESYLAYYLSARPAFPHYSGCMPAYVLGLAADMSLFVYTALSFLIMLRFSRTKGLGSLKNLRLITYGMVIVVFLAVLSLIADFQEQDRFLSIITGVIGLLLTFYFFYSYRHPEVTQALILAERPGRDAESILASTDVEGIIARVMESVDKEMVYRDRDLSLQSFSHGLGVNAYILSTILNERLGKNFRGFINASRVREAKALLESRPDMSVLEIAYEVGFNSKSSFYTAFSSETGCSPAEYRKNRNKQ